MQEGGKKLREIVKELRNIVQIEVSTNEIDKLAEDLIEKKGGEASFKKIEGYKWSVCTPVNEQIVHTPPSERVLKIGDILTLDIGIYYKGFHTDYADTFIIGDLKDNKIKKFLEVGKKTLNKAIDKAKAFQRLGGISETIQNEIESNGYSVIKELTGHGIGRKLHENPFVLGFLDRPIDKTLIMRPGLVIAVEVIYSMESEKTIHDTTDSWTIKTADNSLSACFEHTVAITDRETLVLT